VINTYRVSLLNPAANPSEIEEEYVSADSQKEAELEALSLIARHPFADVELISVELVEPGSLYHEP
jgi:hypothetical protein